MAYVWIFIDGSVSLQIGSHQHIQRRLFLPEVVWEVNWKSLGMDSVKELDDDGS